ncbi:MAG: leucyl aminopeptidase [Bdellovibrionales bacterium]|nr:leucyl aminopeptidase [Bdellovibrionales bacterium]
MPKPTHKNPISHHKNAWIPTLTVAHPSKKSKAPRTDIFWVAQDAKKKLLAPKGVYQTVLEDVREQDGFSAKAGTISFLRFMGKGGAQNLLLVGAGTDADDLTVEKMRVAGAAALAKAQAEKLARLEIQFESLPSRVDFKHVVAFLEGMILSAYKYEGPKPKEGVKPMAPEVVVLTADKTCGQNFEKEIEKLIAVGEALTITRNWSNFPSNYGTPLFYAEEAVKLAKAAGLKAKVLNQAECKKQGMNLFLGVGVGSDRPPAMVVLEYTPPAGSKGKNIALVGKGVTFDSGGISIKPALRMEDMKHDMTGAATVMGAVWLAAKMKVSNRIVAVMGFTENMPSGKAQQPGNVIIGRSGKAVEIINTDAEGRLLLGDALDLAQDYKPDVIVDVATLTGAVSVALGKICCGILGNDDSLVQSLIKAGDLQGERLWQLPLFDEYLEDIKSDVAEIKNSCNDASGGTIRGAMFLKQFIKKGTPWAHMDIAGTAYHTTHLPYFPKKGSNGQFVRTLAHFVQNYS